MNVCVNAAAPAAAAAVIVGPAVGVGAEIVVKDGTSGGELDGGLAKGVKVVRHGEEEVGVKGMMTGGLAKEYAEEAEDMEL